MNRELRLFLAPLTAVGKTELRWSRQSMRFLVSTYLTTRQPPAGMITSVRAIVRVGAMLVALRNADGQHVLPGGRLEPGEQYLQALRREVLEETGLALSGIEPMGFLHFHHLTPKPPDYEYPYPDVIHLVYRGYADGMPRSGDVDGYEDQAYLVSPEDVLSMRGNEYAYALVRAAVGDLWPGL